MLMQSLYFLKYGVNLNGDVLWKFDKRATTVAIIYAPHYATPVSFARRMANTVSGYAGCDTSHRDQVVVIFKNLQHD